MYVAMTRAEEFLFMTRPKMTIQRGAPTPGTGSRFLREIDSTLVSRY
jgi:superfamily I DNA/RNA helicase